MCDVASVTDPKMYIYTIKANLHINQNSTQVTKTQNKTSQFLMHCCSNTNILPERPNRGFPQITWLIRQAAELSHFDNNFPLAAESL